MERKGSLPCSHGSDSFVVRRMANNSPPY